MKVLLVHAYFLERDDAEKKVMRPYPPLGVLYLSAFLKREGHEVQVFDGTFENPESFPNTVRHFEPEVIGVYCNMMTRQNALQLRSAIQASNAFWIAGGPDPVNYAEDYLSNGFDAIIAGEGELRMAAFLSNLHAPMAWKNVAGLIFREGDQLVYGNGEASVADLDSLPFPDRQAINFEAYLECWDRHHNTRPASLITARGCPYQCTWCSHSVYGFSLRKRSPENVLAELEELNSLYRINRYWYADDVFTVIYDWVLQFRDLLQAHPKLNHPFETISRAHRITPEMAAALRDLRCERLWLGAESGSQRLLDAMRRGVNRNQVIEAAQLLHAEGIQVGMFFMWGFLDESLNDILQTVDLAERCLPDTALTTVSYPIKGTPYFQQLDEAGKLAMVHNFREGTDRDIVIQGQHSTELYSLADKLLHHRIHAAKLSTQGAKDSLRALSHRLRGAHAQRKLAKSLTTRT